MRTILVSGASGVVGYGIARALQMGEAYLKVVGTTTREDSAASLFCDVVEKAPHTNDPHYYDWLLEIVEKHAVDLLIPGIEIDMLSWSANRLLLNASVKCVLNTEQLISLCSDKWTFYQDLSGRADPIAIPTYDHGDFNELADKCGLPFLLKPRRGYGSRGIVRVESESVFEVHREQMQVQLIAQPIVGSDEAEYSVSCFADGRGSAANTFSLRRKLGVGGFTEWAEVVDNSPFDDAVRRLCSFYKPVGPTNFQFRVHDGDVKLLEINPRISSASSIRAAFGYNEAVMALEYFLNNRIPPVPQTGSGQAVRYVEDYICRR